MSHTPGPWNLKPTAGHERHGQSVIYAEDGATIAIVYDGDTNGPIMQAAPDMLEACRKLVRLGDWTGPTPKGFTAAWEAAISAIAKAGA